MKILEVKNINKKFSKKQVLKNVSFSIEEGEILGFIGPNGAGKTTTIKLILGLQRMTSGEVYINGHSIKKDFEKAIKEVGAIVESPDLYMYLSGRQNLKLIANMYKDITKERLDEVIDLVGLTNRIDDKVSKYSLGMRQRLGIAASILHNPKLLILDEPTNGLDPEGIKELRDLMKKLAKKEKIAILISSHNLAELESFITDVCLIKSGEILTISSLSEMKKGSTEIYTIEVNSTKKIKELLEKDDKVVDETHIEVHLDKDKLADLVTELVKKDYKIYEVKKLELSLEEAFFEKAGGNTID